MTEELKKCKTVGELKAAIKDLPDDMPVSKWDGCEGMLFEWVFGDTTPVYDRDGSKTIYGAFFDEGEPSTEMLVF